MGLPLINGQAYDFAQVEITLPGVGIVPLQEISYSDSLDYGELRGSGSAGILALTGGTYSGDCSFTCEKQVFNQFLKGLSVAAPAGQINLFEFPISVTYAHPQKPLITDVIQGCKYGGGESSGSGGAPDALVVPVTLKIKRVLWGGTNVLGPLAV